MEAARPRLFKTGMIVLIVAAPLMFTPFTSRPAVEEKFLVSAIGAALVWLSRPPLGRDRWLLWLSVAWVGVVAASALVLVNPDPLQSISGTPWQLAGVATTSICAYLLVAATGFPEWVLGRIPVWLMWVGMAMVGVLALNRFFPGIPHRFLPSYADLAGSTMGLTVFRGRDLRRLSRSRPDAGPVGSGQAAGRGIGDRPRVRSHERGELLGASCDRGGATALKARMALKRAMLLTGVVAGIIALGVAIPPPTSAYSGTTSTLTQVTSPSGETLRLHVWATDLRAAIDRPLLGWGPGNAWSGYLHAATLPDLQAVGDHRGDGHNILVETAVTAGLFGLVVFLALAVKVLVGVFRSDGAAAWVFGAVSGLAAYSLIEPVHVVITPWLFMFAGLAIGPARMQEVPRRDPVWAHLGRLATGVGLVVCLAMSAVTFAAGWADGPTVSKARLAARIEPWRNDATEREAVMLAVQAVKVGDNSDAMAATRLASGLVTSHPWDPFAWVAAAATAGTLGDRVSASIYMSEGASRFPAFFSPEWAPKLGLGPPGPSTSP